MRDPHWTELEDAADVIDDIVAQFFPSIEKARKREPPSTLGRRGYDGTINDFLREALKATRPADRDAMQKAVQAVDKDWKNITALEREMAALEVGKTQTDAAGAVQAKAGPVIAEKVETMIDRAKADTDKRLGRRGRTALTQTDKIIVRFARDSQTAFVADEYGRRGERFSALTRTLVARGLAQGLDSTDIAEDLQKTLEQVGVDRSLWYWRMIASVQMSRARSYGQLRSLKEAGIDRYVFTAVLDERTTEQCRFLDKTVFSVARSLERFERTAELKDPTDLFNLQPFLRTGKGQDGKGVLYYMAQGVRQSVAIVDKAGYGSKDTVGEYTSLVTTAQLQDLGLCTPPLHELCRSIILPA